MTESLSPDAWQELAALVPRRSRWRSLMVVLAVLAAAVLAWTIPPWFHPQLPSSSSGGAIPWEGAPFVLTTHRPIEGQSPFTLRRVGDVPGAQVVGAWITRNDGQSRAMDQAWLYAQLRQPAPSDPAEVMAAWQDPHRRRPAPSDAAEVMAAWRAAGAPLDGIGLPQRLVNGAEVWVLWQITDCDAGVAASLGAGLPPSAPVLAGGPLGLALDQSGPFYLSPFANESEDGSWLRQSGSCPA